GTSIRHPHPTRLFCYRPPTCALRHLLSFPTRRSSDLRAACGRTHGRRRRRRLRARALDRRLRLELAGGPTPSAKRCAPVGLGTRSGEHTSELQSRFDLVCRLLLEKKKAASDKNRSHVH